MVFNLMADRREMLARLNAQTARFDVGQGGGAPSLTTSAIAAALGMVPAGLGREVMEAVYLPDGAIRHRGKLAEAARYRAPGVHPPRADVGRGRG